MASSSLSADVHFCAHNLISTDCIYLFATVRVWELKSIHIKWALIFVDPPTHFYSFWLQNSKTINCRTWLNYIEKLLRRALTNQPNDYMLKNKIDANAVIINLWLKMKWKLFVYIDFIIPISFHFNSIFFLLIDFRWYSKYRDRWWCWTSDQWSIRQYC